MKINIENKNYSFTKKQFKQLKKNIRLDNLNAIDFSYENNKEEYKKFMQKHNIFLLEAFL